MINRIKYPLDKKPILLLIRSFVFMVTLNLRGATLADFFFFRQENESSSIKVSFPEKKCK